MKIKFSRQWAMPNKNTYSIKPISELVEKYISDCTLTIDPFSGGSQIALITNDLNPSVNSDYHMDALNFLKFFDDESVELILFDPPYSSRQVAEHYKKLGHTVNMETTQSSFWSKLKNEMNRILVPGGYVLSFGWNSNGMGKNRKFIIKEILLVPHGGAHYDTICVAEQKLIKN